MVDVELFVSSGAPRSAFVFVGTREDPWWTLDREVLARLGWVFDGNGAATVPGVADPTIPHPFDLGPTWTARLGPGRWVAGFRGGGGSAHGVVVHEMSLDDVDAACDPGPPLTSESPWRWVITDAEGGEHCGRAENPVLAALAVEDIALQLGAIAFVRTLSRRDAGSC